MPFHSELGFVVTRRVYQEQRWWHKASFLLTIMVEHSSSNLQSNFINCIASHYEMLGVKSGIKIKSNLAGVGGRVGNST